MNKFQKIILAIGSIGILATAPAANAVLFTIDNASITPGTGYGIDSNESSGTLLDVRFSTALFTGQSFSLPTVNNELFYIFNVGTVDFEEPDSHGGILVAEQDNLGVTASFTFTNPLGITQNILATGTAFLGNVSGTGGSGAVDYTLSWNPVDVPFGQGGAFRISMDSLTFDTTGSKTQRATITLLSPGTSGDTPNVPEPETLTLLGFGLLGFAATRLKPVKSTAL